MKKTKKIAFGIGIVLTVLVAFTASAAADNLGRFDPQHGNATTGGYVPVTVYADIDSGWDIAGSGFTLIFNPDIIDIYSVDLDCQYSGPTGPDQYCWGNFNVNDTYKENGYIWAFVADPQVSEWEPVPPPGQWVWKSIVTHGIEGPLENIEMYRVWVNPQSDDTEGVSPFEFGYEMFPGGCPVCQKTQWINFSACTVPTTFINGTFTHDYVINIDTDPTATNVTISNMDKLGAVKDVSADFDPETGLHRLALNISSEVEVGDELQITACEELEDEYESNCNVSTHTVVNAPGQDTVNLTLNHYCLDLVTFPMREVNTSVPTPPDEAHKGTGAATAQMNLDYMWWNSSEESEPPMKYNQSYLYDYGLAHNANDSLEYFDAQGMWATIQYLDPSPYSQYGYNFGLDHKTNYEDMLKTICHWVAYTVGSVGGHKEGHPYHVPGAVPAYGGYTNWMSIRGLHTNEDPAPSTWVTPENLEVYGFWVNDPYPGTGGIGENSYKTADEWNLTYYKPLNTGDTWDGEYVAILEPPEEDLGDITIVSAKPRLAEPITPVLAEKPMMIYGVEQMALEKVVKDDESLKIVKAAIDGVTEELMPYDTEFAAIFAKTVPGEPMLVTSDNGDYYVVPFNVPVKVKPPVEKMPVEIKTASGVKNPEGVKLVAEKIELKPVPIKPINVEKTVVVVLVDAEDGSFKEASWVADPVKYLPVSKVEALKLALGEILDEQHIVAKKDARDLEVIQQKPTIELVYRKASPYYPDWKITVNGKVFYVGQDGTVS